MGNKCSHHRSPRLQCRVIQLFPSCPRSHKETTGLFFCHSALLSTAPEQLHVLFAHRDSTASAVLHCPGTARNCSEQENRRNQMNLWLLLANTCCVLSLIGTVSVATNILHSIHIYKPCNAAEKPLSVVHWSTFAAMFIDCTPHCLFIVCSLLLSQG